MKIELTPETWMRAATNPESLERYLLECREAVRDQEVFATFRRNRETQYTTESRHQDWAIASWQLAVRTWPDVRNHKYLFRWLDSIGGGPDQREVEDGFYLTATMASYVADAALLAHCFGEWLLSGRIVEVGGGYGGLAAVICGMWEPESYTLYDLEDVCKLQDKYLSVAGIDCVTTSHCIDLAAAPDLAISVYAFSELAGPTRAQMAEVVFRDAPHGFITWHGLVQFESDRKILEAGGATLRCCRTIPGWVNRISDLQHVWGERL